MPTGFLDLPPELRLEVYREILIYPRPVRFIIIRGEPYGLTKRGRVRANNLAVTRVCSLISTESLSVLYGENVFLVWSRVTLDAMSKLSLNALTRIQHVDFQMVDLTWYSPEELTERWNLLCHLFGHLKKLDLILYLRPREYYKKYTHPRHDRYQEGLDCIELLLKCVSENLPKKATLRIESDHEDILQIMSRFPMLEYRPFKTSVAETISKRIRKNMMRDIFGIEDEDEGSDVGDADHPTNAHFEDLSSTNLTEFDSDSDSDSDSSDFGSDM